MLVNNFKTLALSSALSFLFTSQVLAMEGEDFVEKTTAYKNSNVENNKKTEEIEKNTKKLLTSIQWGNIGLIFTHVKVDVDLGMKDCSGRTLFDWAVLKNDEQTFTRLCRKANETSFDFNTLGKNIGQLVIKDSKDFFVAWKMSFLEGIDIKTGEKSKLIFGKFYESYDQAALKHTLEEKNKKIEKEKKERENTNEKIKKNNSAYFIEMFLAAMQQGVEEEVGHLLQKASPLLKEKYLNEVTAEKVAKKYVKVKPIHIACFHGKSKIVNILAENGANLEEQAENGATPLHWAVLGGNLETVKTLVEKKVDLNNNDNKDKVTPLHIAAFWGRNDIVEFLLSRGAKSLKDEMGKTALDVAKNSEIANLLIQE